MSATADGLPGFPNDASNEPEDYLTGIPTGSCVWVGCCMKIDSNQKTHTDGCAFLSMTII
jgi:hypothetical protein